ncbi:MAG: tetratricopeptide repeat protein [bacterium]
MKTLFEKRIEEKRFQTAARRRAPGPAGCFSFLSALLCALAALACPCCTPREAQQAPKPDLFANAERNAEAIAGRMQSRDEKSALPPAARVEAEEEQNRRRAIENYRALLTDRKSLDPATLESALLNLGHLVFEQCLARHRQAMRAYDDSFKQFQLGYATSRPDVPRYDFAPAREIYKDFLETFPDSPNRPEVLYNIAYSFEEEGDLDQAVSLFGEVALSAPSSRFSPEAYMRLGEHHFELNDFDKARAYYRKVLDLGDTPLYEKALFKVGWCDYAAQQVDEAQRSFARILDLYAPQEGKKKGDLYRESLEILAKILSETGGAPALDDFLKEHHNPPYGPDLSVQLADHFRETSRFKDAIETYQQILRSYPDHPRAPFMEKSLLECLRVEGRVAEAERIEASLLDRYGRRTGWDLANPDPQVRAEADAVLQEILSNQILAHHRTAREKKDAAEYDKAIRLYENYLEYFPPDERAYENRFLLAECLFETGRFERAAEEYARVATEESFLQYRERAGSKRIQCLEALRAQNKADVDVLLAAYRGYIELNPESDQVPLLLFKQGEILYNARRYPEAAALFREIIERYPHHANIRRAWMLVLESHFEASHYPEVERWARDILARDLGLDQSQRARAEHLLQISRFELARAEEKKGNWAQAAESYLALADESPRSQVAPDAMFNAALAFQKAQDPVQAAACFEKILALYPDSQHRTDALLIPLAHYEETKQWDRILEHLDKIFEKDPTSPLARETLYKLAKRLRSEGQPEQARRIFSIYAGRYPQDAARLVEIAYLQAEMDDERGAAQEALAGYKRFLEEVEKARKADPSLTVDPFQTAVARFRVLDPAFEEYKRIRLREPLKQNLAKKQSQLDVLVDAYMKTAQTGAGEYATAAAFRVGELYEDFWKSFLDSEIPKDLAPEEIEVYRDLLRQQAAPYLEKALSAYRVTLERSREKAVFNSWVLCSYGRLSELDAVHYPSLLQDSPVAWQDTWSEKRSLIRKIDTGQPRAFSASKAKTLQAKMDEILQALQEGLQGKAALDRKQVERTAQLLGELLEKEPTLYEVQLDLGVLNHLLGKTHDAAGYYELALKQNTRLPLAHLNLGVLYLTQGDAAAAERHMQELAALTPEYAGAYYLLGVCRLRRQAPQEALEPLQQAISLLPQYLDPLVELGQAQACLGKQEEALATYRSLLEHPKASSRVLRKLSYRLLEEGRLDEAIEGYSRILEGQETEYADWNNRAVLYLRKSQYAPARADLLLALDKNPKGAEALNNMGLVHAAQKEYEKSIACFTDAEQARASFPPALLNAGVIYGEFLKDVPRATEYIQKYIDQGGTLHADFLKGWTAGQDGKDSGKSS